MSLEARGLSVRRDGRLADVDLVLPMGQMVGVVGPNGAGKTTLLRCLAGALVPDSGDVLLDHVPVRHLRGPGRRRALAWLPQATPTPFGYTVRERVALGAATPDAVDDALAAVGLDNLAPRDLRDLSGGERRRAALAAVLAQQARCLILDEPVAALDLGQALAAMAHLARLAGDGRLVVASLHDLRLAGRWPGRLLLLRDGALVADGAPDDVLRNPELADAYGVSDAALNGYLTFS